MRRLLIVTVLTSVLATCLPTQSFAATKVGAKCAKVGATAKVGKTTLKCAANKKWALATKPVLVTPTPTPTPTSTGIRVALGEGCHAKGYATLQRKVSESWVDLAPASGWDLAAGCPSPTEYRAWTIADVKIGDTLRWRVYAPGAWEWFSREYIYKAPIKPYAAVFTPDAPITDFASVGAKSRDSVQSIPITASPNAITLKSEPTIGQNVVDWVRSAGDYAMKYFGSLLPKDVIFNVMIFNSRQWGYTNSLTYSPDNKTFVDDMTRTFPQWGDRPLATCQGGGGFSVGYLDNPLLAIDHGCTIIDPDTSVIAHEFAHSVQSKYGETSDPQCLAPKWFVEGQAQTFGIALAYYNGTKWKEARTAALSRQEQPFPTIMKEMEPISLRLQEYSSGLLMVEYLVARSGWKKSLDLLLEANRIADRACLTPTTRMSAFSEAFKNVYGQTLDQFYTEVYPYLQWAYANKAS